MRYLIALLAMVGILTFTSFVHAAPDANYKRASKTGVLEKVDGKNIIYKGGAKGTGKEWLLVTDDKTKITLDGKEAKLDDLKEGQSLKLAISSEGVLTKVDATSPKSKSKS